MGAVATRQTFFAQAKFKRVNGTHLVLYANMHNMCVTYRREQPAAAARVVRDNSARMHAIIQTDFVCECVGV